MKVVATRDNWPSFQKPVPRCTDEPQLVQWLIAADYDRIPAPSYGFCTDCLPEFKAKMIREGRCENPRVRFAHNRKNGTYGFLA